ncbi:LysR family transcriptional regulator [Burkholderia sp. BCC0397]|uniref:helix-turn-helix domain-containing protein n=1 Tax=Burkholderia sp. BCC0397 TaxID=486876 RepID=UPI00158CAF17|nr:LysR family transcriptional regulator [Burkholderia sp. BCC0397]
MISLDVDTVRTFLLVMEFGILTKAADYLHMTQGVVSVKVKRLEERLGFRLLGRNPRSVRLSKEGSPSSMQRENSSSRTTVRYAGRLVRPIFAGVTHHLVDSKLPAPLSMFTRMTRH